MPKYIGPPGMPKFVETNEYNELQRVMEASLRRLFVGMLFLIVSYLLLLATLADSSLVLLDLANFFGPLSLLLASSISLFSVLRRHPILLWTPYSFYLTNVALFSGIGPLVYLIGNEETLAALQNSNFHLTAYELLRTNLLNSVGIASVFLGFYLFVYLRTSWSNTHESPSSLQSILPLEYVAIFFLVVGGVLRYLVFIPYQFGITDFVLPGAIYNLQYLFLLGLTVTSYLAVNNRVWYYVFWILFSIHFCTVFLEFGKTNVVLTLILVSLGSYMAHKNIKRFAVWGICAVIFYYALNPFVLLSRYEILRDTGSINQATFSERLHIVERVIHGEALTAELKSDAEQKGWTRLEYSGLQAFAMRQRDSGYIFDTTSNLWAVFIPRILWPEKPSITPGKAFFEFITGRDTSNLGLSVFADAYWNMGWSGVVWIGMFMGIMYALMSRWTIYWIMNREFIYLPAIILSIRYAVLSPTTWIVNGVFGPLMIYFFYVLCISVILRIIQYVSKKRYDHLLAVAGNS